MPKLTIAVSALALAFAAPQAASAAGLGSLYSCDASGNANTTGAVVGGLVGALAGSQISKNERTLGAVIGAGIGSAIGNNIGCRMDRKSRQDAQMAFERALETGRAQNWSDASTGTTGRIEVLGPARGSSSYGGGQVYSGRWRYAQGVAPATRVSSVGGMYSANGRINMRAAPNTSAAVIDRLQDGEEIEIGGAVAGGWLAVIEDGYVQGYVSRGVVRPAGGGGGECQLVRQTITERGQASFTERYTACRDSNGGWRLETA